MIKGIEHPAATGSRNEELKSLLAAGDPKFFGLLAQRTAEATTFDELLALSTLRRRAAKRGLEPTSTPHTLRLAMLGGCSLYPLHEMVQHFLAAAGYAVELFLGNYDNYTAEILEQDSELYGFRPDVIFLIPSLRRCRYEGNLYDAREVVEGQANAMVQGLLELCGVANTRCSAEIILANFPLPASFDPGPLRTRSLASDWSFRKYINLQLGLQAPAYIHLCDVEFLAARRGTEDAFDPRAWYETKQLYTPDLIVDVARETAHVIAQLRRSPKKVVVVDLDNTLWGGVIGDDGLDGIELGDTSPRGEAFKAFQQYLLGLSARGVLLAVCSKNDLDKALEPFEKHPEMVLRTKDFVAFKANWSPKSDNIREIAAELNVGLDSVVFVDDNPAEIEIVRQFVPEVISVNAGADPSDFIARVEEGRFFENRTITAEDAGRVRQYQQEVRRQQQMASATDMGAYLRSLDMIGAIAPFQSVDVPRICQLINKSNQFNLTTRRRTEAEVAAVMMSPAHSACTMRLTDRFGDHGLIAVVVGEQIGQDFVIDTWLMSCRVLKRQVEEETVNEIVRMAALRSCRKVIGVYLPTAKNGMVRGLYPAMGFTPREVSDQRGEYELDVASYQPRQTAIQIVRTPGGASKL